MAAWGYEFYLLVLKVSLTSERSDITVMFYLFYRYWWNTNHRRSLFSVFAFSSPSINFSTSLSETSANLPECSSSSEKVSMWKFGCSSRTSPVTVTSSHLEAILWIKFQTKPAARLSGKLPCNWLIMLVTMATPISLHVKDKNNIFTARNEDMIF